MVARKFKRAGASFIHPSKYDPSDPGFRQLHCLRFEIDKSKIARSKDDPQLWEKNPAYGLYKITDIDFYLEVNKHS